MRQLLALGIPTYLPTKEIKNFISLVDDHLKDDTWCKIKFSDIQNLEDLSSYALKIYGVIWKHALASFKHKNKGCGGYKRNFDKDDVSTHLNKVITILTNVYLTIEYCTALKEYTKIFKKIDKLNGT